LKENCPNIFFVKVIVGSRYLTERDELSPDSLMREFSFVLECVNRFSVRLHDIIQRMERLDV